MQDNKYKQIGFFPTYTELNVSNYTFPYNRLIFFNACFIFPVLILCYFISELQPDYIKIFPRECVTHTARHYPQAILFRIGMITNSFFIAFSYVVVYRWVKYQAQRINYKGSIWGWMIWPTEFGCMCEFMTLASLDVGGTWHEHRIAAYTFYFFVFSCTSILTLKIFKRMRSEDSSFMSSLTYWFRYIMMVYLLYLYIMAYFGMHYFPMKKKVVGSINQWLSLYILIFWFFSFVDDWPTVYLKLDIEEMEIKVIIEKETKQQNRTLIEMEEQSFIRQT